MSSIQLRPVEEKDLEKLPEFLSEGFPNNPIELWKSRFDMWWKENPFMNSSIPRGWILEEDGAKIMGFLGNIPVNYQINGKIGKAVASSSWYARPEIKGIWGVRLMYAFLKQANADLFLSTTPVENVEKILKQLGFSPLKLPFNNIEFWYIIDYDKVFQLMINRLSKYHKILSLLLKASSIPIKRISNWRRKHTKISDYKLDHNNYTCSLCTHCDDSFTELWEKNRNGNSTTLYRDAKTLNWLFFAEAVREKRYVIKCTQKPNEKLVGYIAFDLNYYSDVDAKILKMKDAYIPEINEPIISSFLSFSQNLAKELDASGLGFWATNKIMEKILKKKMKIRRNFFFPYYYKLGKDIDLAIENNKDHKFVPSPIDPNRGTL